MNKELSSSAKKYNFLEKLEINYYVDAIDEGRWKIAKIVDFKTVGHRHTIRLHFDGFKPEWDEDFDLPASTKMAPFRRFTTPYTGPQLIQKTIYRPQASLNFENPLADLKRLTKTDKQKLKAEWIIQCYRGDMFILMDSLLTQNARLKAEQYEQVLKFFQAYIQTGIHVLKYSLQKINEISRQNINDPNVIYVNSVYALVSSLPEILFNFNSLVSLKERRVRFYNLFQNFAEASRKRIKNFMLSKDIIQICKSILDYQNPPHRGFPWSTKKQVLILLSGLEQPIQFPKIVDNRQIIQALDVLQYLRFKQAFSQSTIENIRIELMTSLIISGNFEGKLKGLAEIKKFCQGTQVVKKEILKQKILTPNLLNSLTDNSTFNGQIFKRSMPIFEAAAKYDLLTDQILKRIINIHKDKHQLQLKSYYSTLAEFGSILDEKKQLRFFEEFKQFPVDTYLVTFLKDFTWNLINHHPFFKKRYMEPQTGFGFTSLWQIIKQQHPPQVINAAIEAFATLAGDLYYRKVVQKYLIQSFSFIKAGKNVQNSLKIIHLCLSKNKEHNREFASYIESIDKQFGLLDTVISSIIDAPSISSKTISSTFQFLQEVNQFLYKKITVDHIKNLWNLKQCQTSLYKFMRKYSTSRPQKSTEKIVNKKLQPQQIKEIVSKIFMNKALMENYLFVDEEAYRTMDELLVSYNYKTKSIDYNFKHTIRCISMQHLFGLQLYLEIAMNSKDENLSKKSLQRFVQYYLRPQYKNNRAQKISLWMNCADKLTKYMENSPKKYLGYSILFQQIKGRMISINILDPTPASFTTLIKGQNTRKVLTVPRNYSLWKLRQIINEQFRLNNTNFEMYIPAKQSILDMEKQQDFSIVFIEVPKDPSSVAVVVTESRQQHPHFVAIQEFKQTFSTYYAQKIYESLSSIKDAQDQIIALKILQQIPSIKNLQNKILKLQISKHLGWEQILDSECKSRLCYQLSILSKVKSEGIAWAMSFIKKGGIQHLQKILRLRNLSKVPSTIKDYQYLIELIQFFDQMIKFYRSYQSNLPFNESSIIEIIKLSSKDKSNPALQSSNAYLNYFYLTINVLKDIIGVFSNIDGQKILNNKNFQQVLQFLVFTPKKVKMQTAFPKITIQMFEKAKSQHLLSQYAETFLMLCLSNPKLKYQCRVFFDLLVMMFDSNVVTDKLYQKTLQFIKVIRFSSAQVFSEKEDCTNQLIFGWLRITKCLLLKSITTNGKLKSIPETQQKFAEFLITDGLFKDSHRFQSQDCRNQAFQILSILNCGKQIMEKISAQIVPMLTRGKWRKQYEWHVKSFKKRQKNTKVGLKNLAATCYINSLIQQLYHIRQFSQPLLSIQTNSIEDNENIAYELQKIFAYLKNSNRQIFSTESFCDTFILDGQPIDPRIQMDIDQFFHTLMDKLQHNLKKIQKQNIIDDVFQGEYSNLIIGQECQHKSQRIQNFLSMRLQIINKSSLSQALAQFIKGEVLEGENAYFCQKCDKKVKAVKRVCVKSLPDILILTLKRFQFDFDKMQKFKLNSFCQFPQDLSMQPYMRQSLYENQQKLPSIQYMYKLKGVVIHYGISEAGHYTSYIKIQNGEWKYFDDDKISNFNYKDLGQQCFGGIDDNPYSDSSEKIKNAYLLIYERVNKKKHMQLSINPHIKSEVDSQNLNNQQIQILFDPGLEKFFDNNYSNLDKTYILFVHLVSLRSELRHTVLKKCYENCISIFQHKDEVVQWYLQNFSENMIRQFMIYGHFEASFFVASLLIFCINKFYNPDFIKRCMKCLDKTNMVPLNKIYQAASVIPSYFKTLAQYSFHQKVYRIIRQDKASNPGSLSKLGHIRSQFGQPSVQFIEKKDFRSSAELIHSIGAETFKFKNIGLVDLEFFIKKSKKLSLQSAVAKFFAPKFKDEQLFKSLLNQLILQILVKIQFKAQDQHIFKNAIVLLAKFCQLKDESTRKRIARVAEVYVYAIKESLEGYKTMRMLLQGLFSLSFNNEIFREEIINAFNSKDNKKYIKQIRDWMKESDRVLMNVKADRLGYWRKPGKSTYAHLESIENDKPVKPQTYLTLFNSMLQKHNIDFPDLLSPEVKVGERVSLNEFEEYEFQVESKFGLILTLKNNDGSQRYVLEDDVYPLRSI